MRFLPLRFEATETDMRRSDFLPSQALNGTRRPALHSSPA
jgi:hypothetical protein